VTTERVCLTVPEVSQTPPWDRLTCGNTPCKRSWDTFRCLKIFYNALTCGFTGVSGVPPYRRAYE